MISKCIDVEFYGSNVSFLIDYDHDTHLYLKELEVSLAELEDWISDSAFKDEVNATGSLDFDGDSLCWHVPPIEETFNNIRHGFWGDAAELFLKDKGYIA